MVNCKHSGSFSPFKKRVGAWLNRFLKDQLISIEMVMCWIEDWEHKLVYSIHDFKGLQAWLLEEDILYALELTAKWNRLQALAKPTTTSWFEVEKWWKIPRLRSGDAKGIECEEGAATHTGAATYNGGYNRSAQLEQQRKAELVTAQQRGEEKMSRRKMEKSQVCQGAQGMHPFVHVGRWGFGHLHGRFRSTHTVLLWHLYTLGAGAHITQYFGTCVFF